MQRSKSFALTITKKAEMNFSVQIEDKVLGTQVSKDFVFNLKEVIRRLLLFIFLNSENWVTRYSRLELQKHLK